jgi:kynurenine formamidase
MADTGTETEPVTAELLEEYCTRFNNWGRWGPDDQRGTLNFITPAKVLEAGALVKTGKVISLQLPIDGSGPQTGTFNRYNAIHHMIATGTDHVADPGRFPFGFGYSDDSIVMILQGGTQWDGLSHIFRNGKMYNGFDATNVTALGAAKNGIENAPEIVSRGVLLDLPKVTGKPYLEPGFAIEPSLLDEACAAHGVTVGEGDIVLVRTGDMGRCIAAGDWTGYPGGDSPGLSLRCSPWIAERRIAALATDTWGVEVRPNQVPDSLQPMHLVMVVNMGLLVGEIWYLDGLAADCDEDGRYEFLLVAPPLVVRSAVGAPLNPQAIK